MKRISIIGASGHGKVVGDLAKLNGYTDIAFTDNDPSVKKCGSWPVIGPDEMLAKRDGDLIPAVGSGKIRKRIMELNSERNFATLIHPSAVIAEDVEIGEGTVIMAGVVLNPGVKIGKGCIINTSSSVDHDCIISDFCHVAVGAHLCGTVSVGEDTWIGAGAIVSNNVDLCADCVIGAGAVVIKDITEPGTYVGVPARQVEVVQ